jgi:hypothetical protein
MDKNERQRKRYAEDPEYRAKLIAKNTAWRQKNPGREAIREREKMNSEPGYRERRQLARWQADWKRMGFPSIMETYEQKLAEQKGLCAICKQKSNRRFCVDHCDVTKKLRSLLCHQCNCGLGFFCHDSSWLGEAGAYIERWRAIHKAEDQVSSASRRMRLQQDPARHWPSASPRAKGAREARVARVGARVWRSQASDNPTVSHTSQHRPELRLGWTSPLL